MQRLKASQSLSTKKRASLPLELFSRKVNLTVSAFVLFLLFLVITPGLAQTNTTYITNKNGEWRNPSTWAEGNTAPSNINNKDIIVINHEIATGDLKVNNGGTMYVNSRLLLDELVINGKDSRVIVAPSATLEARRISGNIENIQYMTPLPVVLTSFRSEEAPNGNKILWETAQEINSQVFVLERSEDGRIFEQIAEVPASNSRTGSHYQFLDDKTDNTLNYYRLKQIDFDGSYSYSAIIAAANARYQGYRNGYLSFEKALSGDIVIYDRSGRKILERTVEKQREIALSPPAPGVYILTIETGHGASSQKIIF